MTREEILATWNRDKATNELNNAFNNNSEIELLAILKENSLLFYELFTRKWLRCDFAWLNDNSDGPEWTLVEIEKPKLNVFKKDNDPTHEFNHALEQVKSWRRYFNENPSEKRRIFGAVGRFRLILVAGTKEMWEIEKAAKWRIDQNKETDIEIRSMDIFRKALRILEEHPEELWSFANNPKTLPPSELKKYWENYEYMDRWRQMTN
jgi:hypothetical protein